MLNRFIKKIILSFSFNNNGFSLLEIIIVMAIFSFALVGISSLMLQTMQAESLNAGYLKASLFSQEGLELVRGYRDENWLNPALPEWDANFGDMDGEFTIYYGNAINIDDTADDFSHDSTILYYNGTCYDHVDTGTPSVYKRLITVDDSTCGTDCWNVKSEVRWVSSGRTSIYVAETILYDWR